MLQLTMIRFTVIEYALETTVQLLYILRQSTINKLFHCHSCRSSEQVVAMVSQFLGSNPDVGVSNLDNIL